MVVPRPGQAKATGVSTAFFDDSDEDKDDDKGFGRPRVPSAFKKPSMAKPPPAQKKKKTLLMDDDDDDENDFRKPSVTSSKGGAGKPLPKIPGVK